MKHLIRKCQSCNIYTLKHNCSSCGSATIDPHPSKYSPDDKYARYRISDRYLEPTEKKESATETAPQT